MPLVVQRRLGDNTRQVTRELTLLPLNKPSTEFIIFIRMYYFHTLLSTNDCTFKYRSSLETRCFRVTLTLYLVYSHDGVDDRMAMLSK
jgi:hypothetical protein